MCPCPGCGPKNRHFLVPALRSISRETDFVFALPRDFCNARVKRLVRGEGSSHPLQIGPGSLQFQFKSTDYNRMKVSSSTAKALAALSLGGAVLQLSSDSTSGSFLDIFSTVTTSQRRLEVVGKGHFENLPFESLPEPTWGDWIKVHDAVIHWIDMTSCPATDDPAFLTHWDNPDDHKLLGSPMSDDCQIFLRERNPDQFGSRLVRHAFHDAVGGFDGWVNHHDKHENGALLESYSMLRDLYFGHRAPTIPQITGEGDVPIDQLISFADFNAWAATAALLDASRRVYGNNNYNACGPGMTPGVDCDVLPPVKIEYGRSTYYPADPDENGNPDNGPVEIFPANGGASSGQELPNISRSILA